MPTIVDSLLVTLGLDASGFEQGQKAAGAAFDRTKKQALEDAKSIEQAGKQAAEFFSKLKTEALSFFGVVVGATSLANFVKSTIDMAAGTGRLAHNLDMSTQALSGWMGAVRQNGGTSEDAISSISALVNAFEDIQLTGQSPIIPELQLLRISLRDLANPTETLLKLADAFQRMDPRQALNLGQRMGLSPAMINLLEKGRAEVLATLKAQERAYVVTQRDAEAAQKAQQQISLLKDSWSRLGATVLTDVAPSLVKLADVLTRVAEWAETHPRLVELGLALITARVATSGAAALLAASRWAIFGRTVATASAAGGVGAGTLALPVVAPIVGYEGGRWLADQAIKRGIVKPEAGYHDDGDRNPFSAHNLGKLWRRLRGERDGGRTAASAGEVASSGLRPGVLAALYAESGFDPKAFNPAGGGRGAWGIPQLRGVELDRFRAWSGKDISSASAAEQLAYIAHLIATNPTLAPVRNAKDEPSAAASFLRLFERPGSGYAGDMARATRYLASRAGSSSTVSNRHSETHIGKLEVHSTATDGVGLLSDLRQVLANNALVNQADGGLQ